MTKTEREFIEKPDKYKNLVWEYDVPPQNFFKILSGDQENGQYNREWATARVLENVNYYDAISLIDIEYLSKSWPRIKSRLFKPDIKHGYEYLLRKRALPTAR